MGSHNREVAPARRTIGETGQGVQVTTEDKIRALRRVSRPRPEGGWITVEAEHETVRPQGVTVEDALRLEFEVLEKLISEPSPAKSAEQPKPPIDSAELDKQSWTPYREGHSAGWIFTDKAPRLLLDALEKGPATIGRFTYKFSGPEEKPRLFVSRAPVKE